MKQEISEKLAIGIATGILWVQHGFANKLQSFTKNWQQTQRWIFLYLTCLIFGGMSIVILLQPFNATTILKVTTIKSIGAKNHYQLQQKGFLITGEEFEKVQQYKSGHPNLEKEMPGLYDSLKLVEQAFYSQQK